MPVETVIVPAFVNWPLDTVRVELYAPDVAVISIVPLLVKPLAAVRIAVAPFPAVRRVEPAWVVSVPFMALVPLVTIVPELSIVTPLLTVPPFMVSDLLAEFVMLFAVPLTVVEVRSRFPLLVRLSLRVSVALLNFNVPAPV